MSNFWNTIDLPIIALAPMEDVTDTVLRGLLLGLADPGALHVVMTEFVSTDGLVHPKARKQDYCYTLYARPSQAYRQNAGLDENRDGKVTVSDVHRRMLRLFPEAYVAR